MVTALLPGSFDPIHNGHLEVIETAAGLFDRVVVAAVGNPQKTSGMFMLAERVEILTEALAHLPNVTATMHSALVVELADEVGADFILKGLRAVSDFESEMQMAQMNKALASVPTLFLPTASASSFLASHLIREIAAFGGSVSDMVPEAVARRLRERFEA